MYLIVGDPVGDLSTNLVEIVLEQHPRSQLVTGGSQAIDEQLTGGIGFQRTGIADSQNGNIERHKRYFNLGFHGALSDE
ncbi:hypothetical protein D9M73_220680 [compost metagenome]